MTSIPVSRLAWGLCAAVVAAGIGIEVAEAATSCARAEALIRRQGYTISSKTCGGPVHTFSTMKGEAVLIKVDARTGKMTKLVGGD